MNVFEFSLAVGALAVGILGLACSKVIRAIVAESIFHPPRPSRLLLAQGNVRIEQPGSESRPDVNA